MGGILVLEEIFVKTYIFWKIGGRLIFMVDKSEGIMKGRGDLPISLGPADVMTRLDGGKGLGAANTVRLVGENVGEDLAH